MGRVYLEDGGELDLVARHALDRHRVVDRGLADLDLDPMAKEQQLHRCMQGLVKAAQDDEWVVRYSAIFGIEVHLLKYNSINKHQCIMGLRQLSSNSESIKVIRLRATLALQRVNPS